MTEKETVYLTKEEFERFMEEVGSRRDRAMFAVMFWRGLRASEPSGIRITDIALEANTIRIKRLKGSRGGVYRMAPEERAALRLWLEDTRCGERVFPVSRGQVYNLFRRYAEKAGLPREKQHPHILKHSIGTYLLTEGLDVIDVQTWLGHKNINSTLVYAHMTNQRLRAVEDRIYSGQVKKGR